MQSTAISTATLSWRIPKKAERAGYWQIVLLFIAFGYTATFCIVLPLDIALNAIVPHLPWIPADYVNPDPPPLQLAFKCANLVAFMSVLFALLTYVVCPVEQITFNDDHIAVGFRKNAREFPYSWITQATISHHPRSPLFRCLELSAPDRKGRMRSFRVTIAPDIDPQRVSEFLGKKKVACNDEVQGD